MTKGTTIPMHMRAAAAPAWFKSSRSSATSHCVEIAVQPEAVLVRDSKDETGPALAFAANDWTSFIAGVKAAEFDL